jgi:altronate dehydratase small subunit
VKAVLVISTRDNVATALEPLDPGRRVVVNGSDVVVRDHVATGHKVAIQAIPSGSAVVKYGSAIGVATCDIAIGTHVHTHNVASTRGRGDLEQTPPRGEAVRLAEPADERQAAEANTEETVTGWIKP